MSVERILFAVHDQRGLLGRIGRSTGSVVLKRLKGDDKDEVIMMQNSERATWSLECPTREWQGKEDKRR